MSKLVGYARTSTTEQIAGMQAQIRDLTTAGVQKMFTEHASSVGDRPQFERALTYLRGGDTLVVTKLDRLARSVLDVWEVVRRLEAIEDGGAGLRILNFGGDTIDTRSATGRLILTVFTGFAQFEREMMLERQREGIAKARAEGRYTGRKPTAMAKGPDVLRLLREGKKPVDAARIAGISRASVYRILDEVATGEQSAP